MQSFRALVVDKAENGVSLAVREWSADRLMPGDVTIRVEYSSINYKDGLAVRADGRVVRGYPLIPGIDLAGEVIASNADSVAVGSKAIVHGYDTGVAHHGGLAEIARVPAGWVVPLPAGLTTRQAMALGTAGFTAALSVARLEAAGLTPAAGPVIVTGASGGVGSTAIDILAARGYAVAASTGSADAHAFLRDLGATEILGRAETSAESGRPLERSRWAGAVDAVGGSTLAYLLRTLQYGGSIAISGNAGGVEFTSTVFPFILRAVNVLGIDSVMVPLPARIALWERLATDLRPPHLDSAIVREITLAEAPSVLERIVGGGIQGRTVVRTST
ncbi:MAG: oxidoreductase [Chloroflexi bacterium]|nr:oxidoreductase [Chloroflexota bacterium]